MTLPLFFLPPQHRDDHSLATLNVGERATLTGESAKHLQVMRLGVGDLFDLSDGSGFRLTGEVQGQQGAEIIFSVATPWHADPPSACELVVVQALAKSGDDESALHSMIEVGATEIIPWQADRSIVRWKGPKAQKGQQKWSQLALAAAKQSRRATLPKVHDMATTKQLVAKVAQATEAGELVLICHEAADLKATLDRLIPAKLPPKIWLIVGPEGGISDSEIEALQSAGGKLCRLGWAVLRAATAATVALSQLQLLIATPSAKDC
ncbi:hypothetical protein BK816_06085 [Boudabousia tangfeifanii]|uniref:Ribosomal RNA small subunit methyltransferase E n=1 Tax=Boudabousia tangfeifanii TaxID=1912795 RepID=A0A1D9ML67_9ACTO|nr:16S rRNA (uracil(1498)-N(3))-methyltransferase [Boudabousia tangfeifanii]AOZ72913.1 hypothetical protein BK816_06085 [Boudabousia tangfeifanii]